MAKEQADIILQQYDHAREYLARILEREAAEKIEQNKRAKQTLREDIEAYNQAITSINDCLENLTLDRKRLPLISKENLMILLESGEIRSNDNEPLQENEISTEFPMT
jgi:hypothetical protein